MAAKDWEGPGLASPTPADSFHGILLSPLERTGAMNFKKALFFFETDSK